MMTRNGVRSLLKHNSPPDWASFALNVHLNPLRRLSDRSSVMTLTPNPPISQSDLTPSQKSGVQGRRIEA